MYKCRECGMYFDEPKMYTEKYEFWGAPCIERFYTCPHCDGDDFDESSIVEDEENDEEEDQL